MRQIIMIEDYRDYESGKSSNGGKYAFFERYDYRDEKGLWEVHYATSSDFAYCSYCGVFRTGDCPCEEVVQTLTDKQMLERVQSVLTDGATVRRQDNITIYTLE